MFSENISSKAAEKPKREKKEQAPTVDSQRKSVAEVCGAIAGIPRGFRDAGEALRDVKERCDLATKTTGILSAAQAQGIRDIRAEAEVSMYAITKAWKAVDAMIADGVAMPEKPPAEDLF